MKRALLVLLFSACTSTDPVRQAMQSAHCVWSAYNYGTAFPVAATQNEDGTWSVLMLTPSHVATLGIDSFEVLLPDLELVGSAKVLSTHPTADAALLLATMIERPFIPQLCFDDLRLGERVYHSGFGGGSRDQRWVSQGVASSRNRVTTYIAPGDSGSPIIDELGRVVGFATRVGRMPDGHLILGHTYIVPLSDVEAWLKEAIEGRHSRAG